jgi:hypothetical protein
MAMTLVALAKLDLMLIPDQYQAYYFFSFGHS